MAGKIRAEDIEYVKTQTNIADIVSDHVALKNAGIDSMKGLCPFHDERSPSFHVRPNLGYFHCFGCGESGDVISFLQKINHLSFSESVEYLAQKLNYQLTYEEGSRPQYTGPSKTRLIEANVLAQKFFAALIFQPEGELARSILNARGFDDETIKKFGIGYSKNSWHALKDYLLGQGFQETEVIDAGLAAKSNRGSYDRFRNRIMWPIKDASGSVLGFGARKIDDQEEGPKYLNTPETAIYHKSKVLYGIDLAKRAISQKKSVVVVEGYTDVMACHLAGITEAVATCGTAFGKDHINLLRRMMGDDSSARVVFTFDPDEAGHNAALKAFSNEHHFKAQTYVAKNKGNLDPADIWHQKGAAELQNIFTELEPLFAFALRDKIERYNLDTVEGRVSALREAAPILNSIKDESIQRGYVRELASMLGTSEAQVSQVMRGVKTGRRQEPAATGSPRNKALSNDPGYRLERDALMVLLQVPGLVGEHLLSQVVTAQFQDNTLALIKDAIARQLQNYKNPNYISLVVSDLPDGFSGLVHELAVAPMPQKNAEQLEKYAVGVIVSVLEKDLLSLRSELISRLQRINDSSSTEYRNTQEQIRMLEQARRTLRAEAALE